eukprot:s1301_g5.t1
MFFSISDARCSAGDWISHAGQVVHVVLTDGPRCDAPQGFGTTSIMSNEAHERRQEADAARRQLHGFAGQWWIRQITQTVRRERDESAIKGVLSRLDSISREREQGRVSRARQQAELLLKSLEEDGAKAKVEEILNKLRGHEFRVDEAPAPKFAAYSYDPRLAALPLVVGPDPEVVKRTIQEVTKKMVGKEDDLEQDLPLMDLGKMGGWLSSCRWGALKEF